MGARRPWGWEDSGKEARAAEGRRRDGNSAGRRKRKESLPGGGKGGSGHCISAGFAVMLLRPGDDDKAGCGETARAASGREHGGLGLGRGSV